MKPSPTNTDHAALAGGQPSTRRRIITTSCRRRRGHRCAQHGDHLDDEKYRHQPRRPRASWPHTTMALGACVCAGDSTPWSGSRPTGSRRAQRAHEPAAGWRDHRAVMPVKRHPLFVGSLAARSAAARPSEFADLVEERARARWTATPATMLEVAQTIHINGEKKLRRASRCAAPSR